MPESEQRRRIKVYSPDAPHAARLAADLNLSLRDWEYAGESPIPWMQTWANVGGYIDQRFEIEEGDAL